jgi:hypothetical protein
MTRSRPNAPARMTGPCGWTNGRSGAMRAARERHPAQHAPQRFRAIRAVVPIDGKTLRRAHDRGRGKAARHMGSALAAAHPLVVGQVTVDDKSNESKAIPIETREAGPSPTPARSAPGDRPWSWGATPGSVATKPGSKPAASSQVSVPRYQIEACTWRCRTQRSRQARSNLYSTQPPT